MATESDTRRLLRTRDAIDRRFNEPLDVADLAHIAVMSRSHFIRRFKATFGVTPHRYLYQRRIERSQWMLRTTELPIIDICHAVGYNSLGTFTRTFRTLVGETPTHHRRRGQLGSVPHCVVMAWTRPSNSGETLTTIRT